MNIFKSALAGAAAAALLASQAAAAATMPSGARAGAAIDESEGLGGLPASATPALTVLAIFILAGAVALIAGDDDDDEAPVSP